jgi:hypothetical protein
MHPWMCGRSTKALSTSTSSMPNLNANITSHSDDGEDHLFDALVGSDTTVWDLTRLKGLVNVSNVLV